MAKVKTKFDSLVKLKKVKIDEIENQISKMNAEIQKVQEELESLKQEIAEFEYPKSGNFSLITQFKMMQKALLNQLTQKENNIKFLENQKNILANKLKEANLEYEKMKYLQGEEIKKYLNKLKEKESKEMDEIALMLYKG
jgi:flagellar export protein FliJ